jgi:trans-aconitate methyltransferase
MCDPALSSRPAAAGLPTSEVDVDWHAWLTRWDQFQENYVPHREHQFSLMVDYAGARAHREPLRVLDLACGPGSLATRLAQRFPEADVVGIDRDPWLLELARQTAPAGSRATWVDADLRDEYWVDRLPHRAFSAVLMTTALHWFDVAQVRRLYASIAQILETDGRLLIGDVMPHGTERARWLAADALFRWQAREVAKPGREDWPAFWRAARAEPAFRDLLAERDRRLDVPLGRPSLPLAFHLDELAEAGFRETGEVWRCHATAVVLAIR